MSATFVINTSSSQYHDFNSTIKIGTSSKYLSHDSGVQIFAVNVFISTGQCRFSYERVQKWKRVKRKFAAFHLRVDRVHYKSSSQHWERIETINIIPKWSRLEFRPKKFLFFSLIGLLYCINSFTQSGVIGKLKVHPFFVLALYWSRNASMMFANYKHDIIVLWVL